jgi:aminopeptidase
MAQQAGVSTEAFEDFYFKVCSADYAAMSKAVKPLKELMNKTDRVRITAKDTDLQFSIKGIDSIPVPGK